MRDVTGSATNSPKDEIKSTLQYLANYLRHPVQEITHLPDWGWSKLLIVLAGLAMTSGVITGFIPPNVYRIAGGVILAPMVSLALTTVMALFLYYYFQVFEKRTCSLRKLFTMILFANIPFFIFQIGSEIVPPLTLVGYAFTAMLMVVGLTSNFEMEKRRSIRLVAIIFAVVFVLWLWNRIDISSMT